MYVCTKLTDVNADGVQTCLEWAVMQSILPPLSLEQSAILGSAFWLVLAVAKGFRQLKYVIEKF